MNSEFTDDILEVVRKHYDISAIFTDEKVIEFVRSEFYVSDVFPDEVGKLIERVEELEVWMEKVEKIPAVKEAALFGSSIHAVVGNAADAIPAVKKLIEAEGVKDFTVRRIEPTLEDVFVDLIENYDEDNQGEPKKS